jgi:hypothetical protein
LHIGLLWHTFGHGNLGIDALARGDASPRACCVGSSLPEIATELARAEAAAKTRTEKLSVNKLTWAQVGWVTEPVRYMFTFGWLTITAEDLALWEQYPNAAFTLLRTAPAAETEDEFR